MSSADIYSVIIGFYEYPVAFMQVRVPTFTHPIQPSKRQV